VSIPKPDELDYDEQIYEDLQSRNKDLLHRFFNYYADQIEERPVDRSAHTQDQFCKIIAAKLEDEITDFLEQHNRLVEGSIRVDPTLDFLAEHYNIEAEDLDASNRYELLLLLYETDLIENLDELVIRSRIRSYSAKRAYVLKESLTIDNLPERLQQFHSEWNKEQEDPEAILVDKEFETENIAVLKIYQEAGQQSQNTFQFRENEADEIPATPELTTVSYQQLKTIRFQLELLEDETKIIFTESYTGWYRTLNTFFESVFQVEDFVVEIEEEKSVVAEELEEEIVDSIEEGDDPVERARNKIEEQRTAAEERIEGIDQPEERRKDLKERIRSIEISGSEVVDDPSIETQEFRLIAGLEGLFDSVDIEQGFRDLIKKAESDKQSFVITISNRPVQFSDGTWDKLGTGTLPDRDQRALQIFFDGEDSL
jgi:hypothetical protein